MKKIVINVGGIWAGTGKLIGGRIEECGAVFSEDPDSSDRCYEAIDAALSEGATAGKFKTDEGELVEWYVVS